MSAPPVHHLLLTSTGSGRRKLLEASIDTPRDGGTSNAWAVRVRGHILSDAGPVPEIAAVVPGSVLAMATTGLPTPEVAARHPDVPWAAECGFTLLVDTLGLPQRFEFRLRAALPDGSRVKVAAIDGERRALTTAYAHPGVVVYARPPYEARGGKYWLHVLKTLAAPTDARKRVGAPMEFHLEPLAAGGNPFYSAEFAAWPEVEAWSGSTYVTDLAAFCQRSIDGWYLATAAAQSEGEDTLVYFAEKHFPDAYPRLLRELYPGAHELFLVRDFRDMLASMRAYNARKGFGDFGRQAAPSDASWLAELRRGIVALRDAWRERGDTMSLVRYEDLVRTPEATLPPLLESLGLDAAPQTVASLIAAAAPDAPELRGHGTAGSPAASIGRWRHDLSPALQAAAEETFGDLLEEFGYASRG
jgi:hypothetical protein